MRRLGRLIRVTAFAGALACAFPAVAQPYPAERLEAARDYLRERAGVVAVALADKHGVHGFRTRRRYETASVVKALLLVGYLRKVDGEKRELTLEERDQLEPMIQVSANEPATWVADRLGLDAIRALATEADMDDFTITGPGWAGARTSASDQAKFFRRLRRLTPPRFREYATWLLGSVVEEQSWGIPRVARRRGFAVFHKGGWGSTNRGQLVHQASFLRRGNKKFSLVVLTDGNPTMGYGMGTIRGVARKLVPRS